jgi:putative ABC transport system permease protein
VLGTLLGLVFGTTVVSALKDQGLTDLAVPWTQLVIFLLVAAVAGVLAAVLPARRAARLDVLKAIGTE